MQAVCQMNPSNTPGGGQQDFGLTALERQVILLVAAGYTNRDLAQKLGISENIAQCHLRDVLDKLGVANCLELVLRAVDAGLTEED